MSLDLSMELEVGSSSGLPERRKSGGPYKLTSVLFIVDGNTLVKVIACFVTFDTRGAFKFLQSESLILSILSDHSNPLEIPVVSEVLKRRRFTPTCEDVRGKQIGFPLSRGYGDQIFIILQVLRSYTPSPDNRYS